MDFALPPRAVAVAARVRRFVDERVVPLEQHADHPDVFTPEQLAALREQARAEGIYGPQLPEKYGGLGLNLLECCPVFEAAGRSLFGPLAIHCAAPDEGTMHLLQHVAAPEQQERYLRPLAEGRIRSAFAMTEPAPGAGADPTMIRTTAERRGDDWVINGHKWYATGAEGAAFYLVMARTDPNVPAVKGCTLFLVDAGTPGMQVTRRIEGLTIHNPGGHCEMIFENCVVSNAQVLGEPGRGFKLTQVRLGPARLTHCMRWTGVAQRALDIATARMLEREAFGVPLAQHEGLQWMLADSAIELQAARLMTQQAAWKIVQGDEARNETAMAKVFVSEVVNRIVDRAIQICGALGISDELPLHAFYREARAFRIYDGPSEVHRMVIARNVLKNSKEPRTENREP